MPGDAADERLSGYLATDEQSYADAMMEILTKLPAEEARAKLLEARESSRRFSEEGFASSFLEAVAPLF